MRRRRTLQKRWWNHTDEEDDAADALEVAEQISLDEPHEQPDTA